VRVTQERELVAYATLCSTFGLQKEKNIEIILKEIAHFFILECRDDDLDMIDMIETINEFGILDFVSGPFHLYTAQRFLEDKHADFKKFLYKNEDMLDSWDILLSYKMFKDFDNYTDEDFNTDDDDFVYSFESKNNVTNEINKEVYSILNSGYRYGGYSLDKFVDWAALKCKRFMLNSYIKMTRALEIMTQNRIMNDYLLKKVYIKRMGDLLILYFYLAYIKP